MKGHRDLVMTACPGSFLYNWLQAGMPVTERNLSGNELSGVKAHIDRLGASLAKKPLSKRRKSRGEAVSAQERLKALGFDPGPVDGVYGKLTKTAVLAFQRRYRDFLIQDGIIGANTWRMLFS